jgi:hypothetical protein
MLGQVAHKQQCKQQQRLATLQALPQLSHKLQQCIGCKTLIGRLTLNSPLWRGCLYRTHVVVHLPYVVSHLLAGQEGQEEAQAAPAQGLRPQPAQRGPAAARPGALAAEVAAQRREEEAAQEA